MLHAHVSLSFLSFYVISIFYQMRNPRSKSTQHISWVQKQYVYVIIMNIDPSFLNYLSTRRYKTSPRILLEYYRALVAPPAYLEP